jgi:hypothetical protein
MNVLKLIKIVFFMLTFSENKTLEMKDKYNGIWH